MDMKSQAFKLRSRGTLPPSLRPRAAVLEDKQDKTSKCWSISEKIAAVIRTGTLLMRFGTPCAALGSRLTMPQGRGPLQVASVEVWVVATVQPWVEDHNNDHRRLAVEFNSR